MDATKLIFSGFVIACLSGGVSAYFLSMMEGFYVFAGFCVITSLLLFITNIDVVKIALDLTPMRIASWLIFLVSVIIIAVIYASEFDFPLLPAIFVSLLSAWYLFHTWYTLEPQKG
tara:strand:- start:497 stop:844 length:348 start_codon:yes stop_codon:yes gene_type:complete